MEIKPKDTFLIATSGILGGDKLGIEKLSPVLGDVAKQEADLVRVLQATEQILQKEILKNNLRKEPDEPSPRIELKS